MTSPAMKLDTLAYAEKLIAAGCDPKLAKAHASAQQDVLVEISDDYLSQFVTKQDALMTEQRIDAKIDALETKITLKMGAMLTAAVFVLVALLKLHW